MVFPHPPETRIARVSLASLRENLLAPQILPGLKREALQAIERQQGPHEEGDGSVSEILSQAIRHLFNIKLFWIASAARV